MLLSELAPLVNAQQGLIYVVDAKRRLPRLRKLAGYADAARRRARAELRRRPDRAVRRAARADPAARRAAVAVQIESGLVSAQAAQRDRAAGAVRGRSQGGDRAASLDEFTDSQRAFLEQLTGLIGIVLNTISATMRTESLLSQSQQLATELQSQQAELQQTNEELALKAKLLAEQNAEVERKNQEIEHARRAVEEKAAELALTSRYKSEFLANMSHELRTPLNSILILGQQLADNPEENLSDRQVEFAKTIHAAGTDLLNLISDILDLSKIESGTVTVENEDIPFSHLRETIERSFRHEAERRHLDFSVAFDADLGPRHQHRLQAPAADRQEPAVERLQVHREGRRQPARRGRHQRLEPGPSGAVEGADGGRDRGHRHRHRHFRREAEDRVRGLPAGRRRHRAQVRRHRPGPGDQPRARRRARRRDPPGEQAGRRQFLHPVPAAGLLGAAGPPAGAARSRSTRCAATCRCCTWPRRSRTTARSCAPASCRC
jgi:signal transduction histidine kinase